MAGNMLRRLMGTDDYGDIGQVPGAFSPGPDMSLPNPPGPGVNLNPNPTPPWQDTLGGPHPGPFNPPTPTNPTAPPYDYSGLDFMSYLALLMKLMAGMGGTQVNQQTTSTSNVDQSQKLSQILNATSFEGSLSPWPTV